MFSHVEEMAMCVKQTEGCAGTLIDHVHEYRGCIRPIPALK